MTLDKIDNGDYVLQNTLVSNSASCLRISMSKRYYVEQILFHHCYDQNSRDYFFRSPKKFFSKNVKIYLINEDDPNIKSGESYLFPWAYKITLTP